MPSPLVANPDRIRLAMLGMVEGNGHPFSWSAIVNGRYDAEKMSACGYPVIPQYLGVQPPEALGIPGVEVTHVWCDDPHDAQRVAESALVEHVVDRPEDVVGHVDAIVIATDIGRQHVNRAGPFIEAGLPIFIDKPMVDCEQDLGTFDRWYHEGKAFLSTSAMRYAQEFHDLRDRMSDAGEPRAIVVTMAKSWERYGIHAIEAAYGMLPPGEWQSVRHSGDFDRCVVHARHGAGVEVVLVMGKDMLGGFGCVDIFGTTGRASASFGDTFTAFKRQLEAFVGYLRTSVRPVPWPETLEQMKIVIAGLESRDADGRLIELKDIAP